MRRKLQIHPESRGPAAMQIEAEASRSGIGLLKLCFFVTGPLSDVLMPSEAVQARANELWHHTCFEAFVCAPSSSAYYEFNFAPSRQWAAYRFSDYRTGMHVATEVDISEIGMRFSDPFFDFKVCVQLGEIPELPRNASWSLGLSAVIEETTGRKSYWALAHPPGRPDFHHRDCFDLELPAP